MTLEQKQNIINDLESIDRNIVSHKRELNKAADNLNEFAKEGDTLKRRITHFDTEHIMEHALRVEHLQRFRQGLIELAEKGSDATLIELERMYRQKIMSISGRSLSLNSRAFDEEARDVIIRTHRDMQEIMKYISA